MSSCAMGTTHGAALLQEPSDSTGWWWGGAGSPWDVDTASTCPGHGHLPLPALLVDVGRCRVVVPMVGEKADLLQDS